MLRFLFVCDAGNVRSHALAVAMKRRGHEAIAVGRKNLSAYTMATFCEWATHVVIVQPHMVESIPEGFSSKVTCVDIGPDRWGTHMDPDLYPIAERHVDTLLEGT